MCTQRQGGLARAQETSCQITGAIITVRRTFGQGSMWYIFDLGFSDPVTETCLCYLFYTKKIILHLVEAKRKENSQVTCKYCKRVRGKGAAVKLCKLKGNTISNIILF